MATSSDFVHDFPCTPCSEDDINKEAVVFCVNCSEYFCKSCYRVHNRVAETKDHQILEGDDFKLATRTQSTKTTGKPQLPTEKCTKHHGKSVDMLCEDHDVVGCSACIATEHRPCRSIVYIPDVADDRLTDKVIQDIKRDLTQELDKLKRLKQDRQHHKSRLKNEKDGCLDKVNETRKAINKHLDKLQNEIIKDITDTFMEFNDKLDDDMKTCDNAIAALDKINNKLEKSINVNASQTYVNLKHAEKCIKKAEENWCEREKNRNDLQTIDFEKAKPFSEVMSPDTLFGILNAGYRTPQSLEETEYVNIKSNSDTKVCDSFGLCQLPDGTIILTDWNNKKIKSLKYDKSYTLSDSLSMSNSPWGVCCVNDHEVAVTLRDDHKVDIVSVGQTMNVKKSYKVGCRCHSIAYTDRRLYIGHYFDSKLTVYDLQGNCLQTISTDPTGNALFGKPLHISIMPETQHILVADASKGLLSVDMSGKLVSELTYPNMKWTHGVCHDDGGNVYIADFHSKEILTVNLHNTSSKVLATLHNNPRALLFDTNTRRLLVTTRDSNQILTYSKHYQYGRR